MTHPTAPFLPRPALRPMRPLLRSLLLFPCLLAACATPTATAPVAPQPPAVSAPTPAPAAEGDETPTVAIDLTELHFRIEADGSMTQTRREVYRLRTAEPGRAWANAYEWWRPWREDPPTLTATVIAPDGTTRTLDPKTISDQANRHDDGLITDEKLRLAPLPNLSPGAVVDRTAVSHLKPLLVRGASVTISLAPQAPEKKRVVVFDVPADGPLHLETLDTTLTPTRTTRAGRLELRFEQGPTAPLPQGEPGAPPHSTPDPTLRVSTVESWQAAASAWAQTVEPQLGVDAVRELAQGLVQGLTTREAKVAALAAWVRRNVHYVGLELEESAWVPRSSRDVIERRYGDCKDLAVLLTALLRAVGIDADPALVAAGRDRDASPGSPGLSAFNHALVRVGSGPVLWLDGTAPWTALGEVPPSVLGHLALVARADTTGLTPVTASAGSRLDTTFEWFFAPSGPARIVRTRSSEGWFYDEARESAARSPEAYRKNVETWARKTHDAPEHITVDASDAAAPGLFRESLDITGSHWGSTDPEFLSAFLNHDQAFSAVNALLQAGDQLDGRKNPLFLPCGAHARVTNVYHLPPGYRLAELPEPRRETVGPLTVALEWRRGAGDDFEGALEVDFRGGTFSVEQAQHFVKDVFPHFDLKVRVPNVVFAALKEQRYHTAVKAAEALLADHPGPVWRSLTAYALASAGLQADAEAEGRRALAEAPRDLVVRNRLAFVLLHNDQGLEFASGFKRVEVLKLLEDSIALDPANEWARRLHALVVMHEGDARFPSDPAVLVRLEPELREYREKTKGTDLDDELIDVWLKQQAWDTLARELKAFPRTTQRDAAWLTAEMIRQGVEPALRKATQESRVSKESAELAIQYLMMAREYDAVRTSVQVALKAARGDPRSDEGLGDASTLLAKIHRQPEPAAGTVEATWTTLTSRLLAHAPTASLRDLVDGEVDEDQVQTLRRFSAAVLGELPRGASDVSGFVRDFLLSATRFETRPVPGFGELVTVRSEVRGLLAPASTLMRKGPHGYRVRLDFGPAMAAQALSLHQQGKVAEARELLQALALLVPDAPAVVKEERGDFEEVGFAWAAALALKPAPSEPVVRWLEKEAVREASSEAAFSQVMRALSWAWREQPARALALAGKLEKSPQRSRREAGLMLRLGALRGQGKNAEALAKVEQALAQAPRDRFLRELKSDLLPKLGRYDEARALNRELAAEVDVQRAATYLNDSAWWALFGKVDDAAVQEIERALQIRSAASFINTAVCVYAVAGRHDSAARESRRMTELWATDHEQDLPSAYWFARALVAEGFGRVETARALYLKVQKPPKGSGTADVWELAQKRLTALGGKR